MSFRSQLNLRRCQLSTITVGQGQVYTDLFIEQIHDGNPGVDLFSKSDLNWRHKAGLRRSAATNSGKSLTTSEDNDSCDRR